MPRSHQPHVGARVSVGKYTLHAGGSQDLAGTPGIFREVDIIVPLNGKLPTDFEGEVLSIVLQDFGGVPHDWEQMLREQVVPRLEAGKKVLVYCTAGHGRTGTFLASLIALLEPDVEDPIATVRARHCEHAVESRAQAEAIFALLDLPTPELYTQLY